MKTRLLLLAVLALPALPVRAEDLKGAMSLGANAQGLGLRWFPASKLSFEARAYSGSDIRIFGLRSSYHIPLGERTVPFVALEGGAISDLTDGRREGRLAGVFVGTEQFYNRRLSFQFEAGAAYIALKNAEAGGSAQLDGVDFIANAQVNFHFWRPKQGGSHGLNKPRARR